MENENNKLNNNNENLEPTSKIMNKYNLLSLDNLDEESQSLFKKLEELNQRQNSLQKLLKNQSLTIENDKKNIVQFTLDNDNNRTPVMKKSKVPNDHNDKIDIHVQKAIEGIINIYEIYIIF